MFKSKTLFVVGAGASKEVGLPIGDSLASLIGDKLNISHDVRSGETRGNPHIIEALRGHVQSETSQNRDLNHYYRASRTIAKAMPLASSIDTFVEARRGNTEIELCSKLAIVQSILEEEHKSKLYVNDHDPNSLMRFSILKDTWFDSLAKILFAGVGKTELDKIFKGITFVVFNYDRCIEHFLFGAVPDN